MTQTVLHIRGIHSLDEPLNTMQGSKTINIMPDSTIDDNIRTMTNHDHSVVLFDGHGPEVGARESGLALYYQRVENSRRMVYLRKEDASKMSWNEKIFLSTA